MLDERDGLGVEEHEGASAGEAHASGAPTSPVGAPLSELTSTELGVRGEQAAARYLAARGWEILERNWRCPYGEADIVARDVDGTIVLVEVKTRRETDGDGARGGRGGAEAPSLPRACGGLPCRPPGYPARAL